MKGRTLFIVARDDASAEGLRLPKIRVQYEKALELKFLVILEGSAHAQFLFQTNQGDRITRDVRFLEGHDPRESDIPGSLTLTRVGTAIPSRRFSVWM